MSMDKSQIQVIADEVDKADPRSEACRWPGASLHSEAFEEMVQREYISPVADAMLKAFRP